MVQAASFQHPPSGHLLALDDYPPPPPPTQSALLSLATSPPWGQASLPQLKALPTLSPSHHQPPGSTANSPLPPTSRLIPSPHSRPCLPTAPTKRLGTPGLSDTTPRPPEGCHFRAISAAELLMLSFPGHQPLGALLSSGDGDTPFLWCPPASGLGL